jgi:hypothetical protein
MVTLDQMIDMLNDGDISYYDNNYDDDWGGINAHDRAQDSEAFYSCWDNSQ